MAFKIQRASDDRYLATVTPPDSDEPWTPQEPMLLDALMEALLHVGCHLRDIADAFIEADPSTRSRFGIID